MFVDNQSNDQPKELNLISNSSHDKQDEGIGDHGENKDKNKKNSSNDKSKDTDPTFKRLLWYLIYSTRGGINRVKILDFVTESPSNANQISTQLKLDYKTILHHLAVLKKNGLIIIENEHSYGATYFTSPIMEKNYYAINEIMDKIGKK